MDYNQSYARSNTLLKPNIPKNTMVPNTISNHNLPPTNHLEKRFSEISKNKKSDNNIFYTNSIINAAKNATKSMIRSNSTSSIANGKKETDLGSSPLNVNLFNANNFSNNNTNTNKYNYENNFIKSSDLENQKINNNFVDNNLVKNVNSVSHLSDKSLTNSNANSNTNTGTHNSKSNLDSNYSVNETNFNENTNCLQSKIPPFIPKPGSFLNSISHHNNHFNQKSSIETSGLISNNNNYSQNLKIDNQEARKSLRKVIDLNYLNQRKNSLSSAVNNTNSNSNSILDSDENKLNTIDHANTKADNNFSSFKSSFLVNDNNKREEKGPVKVTKDIGKNIRSVSPYISRLDQKNKKSVNNNFLVDESRKNSIINNEIIESSNLNNKNNENNSAKKIELQHSINEDSKNFMISNKFESFSTNGNKILNSYQNTTVNTNNNLNTNENPNCISKNSSFMNSISNINNNFSDDKNNTVIDYSQYLKDLNLNISNPYSDGNNKLNESKNEGFIASVNNNNSKQTNNNYALRNLDNYLNNPTNVYGKNNNNNVVNKQSIISPNGDIYYRKPNINFSNEPEISYKNKTIDIEDIKGNNTNANHYYYPNDKTEIGENLDKHQSQKNSEITNSNYINSAINNTNLPSNNVINNNKLNSNFVYTSSKSIGKNVYTLSRDIQIGNLSNKNSITNSNSNNIIYNKNNSQKELSKDRIYQIENKNNLSQIDTNNLSNLVYQPSLNRSSSTRNIDENRKANFKNNSNDNNYYNNPYKTTTLKVSKTKFSYGYSKPDSNENNYYETSANNFTKMNFSNLPNPIGNNCNNFNSDNNGSLPNSNTQRETINYKNFSFGSKNIMNANLINSNFNNPFNTLETTISQYNPNINSNNTNKINNNNHLSDNTFKNNYNNQPSKIRKSNESHNTQQDFTINLEDLLVIEEKLFEILSVINTNEICYHECFDWWNLYFNSSLCGSFEHYFKDIQNKQIIREYMFSEMICICLAYDSCFDLDYYESITYILKTIFYSLHENFLILCDYFLSKISSESYGNIWVKKLEELITQNLKLKDLKNKHTKEIKNNNKCIFDYIKLVLKNHPNESISDPLNAFINNLTKLSVTTLNDFFRSKIIRIENKKASNLASCLVESGDEELKIVPAPYLKDKPEKEYCLVLDLDETLIHFKIDAKDDSSGVLRLRPGIYKFLDEVSKYYEIIVFTAATSDVIIKKSKIYFLFFFLKFKKF